MLTMQGCIDDSVIERTQELEAGESNTGGNTLDVAGEMNAGEVKGGEMSAGEAEGGETSAGEAEGGEMSAGEAEGGEMSAGEAESGEMSAGETEGGEMSAGEAEGGEPLALDEDEDNDGILNQDDNCPLLANNSQRDRDDDGIGNPCDNCPEIPNFDQADEDSDGVGDACEAFQDSDDDGTVDTEDNCPNLPNPGQIDSDLDGIGNRCDNCPEEANFDQADEDADGIGDLCDESDTPVTIILDWDNSQLDFDLHLINSRGRFFSQESDCWSQNQSPEWAQPGLSGDAPQNGETQELISIDEPSSGWHTVAVDLFTRRGSANGTARLSLSCNGTQFAFGPQNLNSENNSNRSMWQVFRFDPITCEVEEFDTVNSVTCSGARITSCQCVDCEQGPCANCPEDAECDPSSGQCDDICADVTCDEGELCDRDTGECTSAQCLPCENESDCPVGSYCVLYRLQNVRACGVTCETNDDCDDGQSCNQIFRDRQLVNVCADLENACQADPCEAISCEENTVCDPSDGSCVECLNSEQCGENEACVDQSCVEIIGQDREYSSWGDGNTLPSCDQCTEEESCQEPPFVDTFCALPCNEALACPEGLSCCNVDNFGLSGSICIDPRNSFAGFICGG